MEAKRAAPTRARIALHVPDDTDAGNTYVYPSTFGIYLPISLCPRRPTSHGTWVVDFDWLHAPRLRYLSSLVLFLSIVSRYRCLLYLVDRARFSSSSRSKILFLHCVAFSDSKMGLFVRSNRLLRIFVKIWTGIDKDNRWIINRILSFFIYNI